MRSGLSIGRIGYGDLGIVRLLRVACMTQLVDGDDEGGIKVNGNGRAERLYEPRRVVLFVALAGTISDRLIHALDGSFRGLSSNKSKVPAPHARYLSIRYRFSS